jgi:hypothetical protein
MLHAFWVGSPLTRLEVGVIQSIVNQEHPLTVYTYNDISGFLVDNSGFVTVVDAREILSEKEIFSYTGRHAAYTYLPFSDLFRIMVLHKKGGIWIDLDLILMKPIPQYLLDRPYIFSSERTIQKGAYKSHVLQMVNIGFMKVPGPNSEFTSWLLKNLPKKHDSPMVYSQLIKKCIETLGLSEWIVPPETFCPINWWDVPELFNGKDFKAKYGQPSFDVYDIEKPEVIGIHLWRAILRKKALPYDKNTGLTNYYNGLLNRFC